MAKIPLRVYVKEIDHLIERGEIEQAISHAKNILKSYPKHIETYRLLGKAYLESQRYSEAADILQRVLSVTPDDFVSQIGMSIIREDEGNHDAAIWHMERAYEIQPFNPAVQDELRRLYGRRDGVEPPKIRLTRGALVRMYLRGELYPQAIAETRAALAEDPQRLDLQVLLARLYYLSGQKLEAIEICSSLLSKLAYCLEANQILTEVLPGTNRAEDTANFQQRINALDPYAAFISPSAPTASQVPDQAVQVEQFIWDASMQEGQAPEWTRNIGVQWETPAEEALPDWLSSLKPETSGQKQSQSIEEKPTATDQQAASSQPTDQQPAKEQHTGQTGILRRTFVDNVPESPAQQEPTQEEKPASPASDSLIPDWMKDAGWAASDRKADEIMAEQSEESAEDIAPAQIPDWLQSIAPPSESQSGKEEDLSNWLDNLFEKPGDNGKSTSETPPLTLQESPSVENSALPDWLSDIEGSKPATGDQAFSEPEPTETASGPGLFEADGLQDWLSAEADQPVAGPDAGKAFNIPAAGEESGQFSDWAQPDNLPAEPQEPAPAESQDWFNMIEPQTDQAAPSPEATTGWMDDLAAPAEAETAQPANDMPDWLQSLNTDSEPAGPALDWMLPGEPEAQAQASVEEALPSEAAGTIPDWLQSLEHEKPAESQGLLADALPSSFAAQEREPAQQEPEQAAQSTSAAPDFSDMDAAMAWLEGLAAKQGADENTLLISKPEDRKEEAPEWIRNQAEEAIPSDAVEQPDVESVLQEEQPALEAEIPDWLQDMGITDLPTGTEMLGEPLPGELAENEPAVAFDAPFPQEQVAEAAPEPPSRVKEPAETSAAPDFSDMDAAMAWLEALAAKQGADENTLLISKPEDRTEQMPEWIRKQTGELPALEETPAAEPDMAVEAELPDWLRDIQSPKDEVIPDQAANEQVEQVAQPEAELPSAFSLADAGASDMPQETAPAAESAAAPDFSDMDAAMAWLEGLAAKQGADENTLLISKPEDRKEEAPEWIRNQAEEASTPVFDQPAAEEAPQLMDFAAADAALQEESAPQEEAAPQEEMAHPATEVPEWLLQEEESPKASQPVAEASQEQAMPDFSDMDAAMAWLEGLAAKQGADENTLLISKPEDRTEEMPEWIRKQTGSLKLPEEEQPEAVSETQQAPAEETRAELSGPAIFEVEETAEVEIPAIWAETSGAEEDAQPAPEEMPGMDEMPAWLVDEPTKSESQEPLSASNKETEWAPEFEATVESEPAAPQAESVPAWLQAEPNAEPEQEFIAHEEAKVPDWLAKLEEEETRSAWAAEVETAKPAQQAGRPDATGGYSIDILQTALMRGDLDTALAGYERLIQNGDRLDETIHDLRDALYRYPVDISIWQTLGDAYARNNQLQEALDAYTKAEELLR